MANSQPTTGSAESSDVYVIFFHVEVRIKYGVPFLGFYLPLFIPVEKKKTVTVMYSELVEYYHSDETKAVESEANEGFLCKEVRLVRVISREPLTKLQWETIASNEVDAVALTR